MSRPAYMLVEDPFATKEQRSRIDGPTQGRTMDKSRSDTRAVDKHPSALTPPRTTSRSVMRREASPTRTTPSQKGGSLAASPSRSACSRRSASGSRSETSSSGAPGWQPNKEAHILKKYFLWS
jgi:hypothetical protein